MRPVLVNALSRWVGAGAASLLVPGWFFFAGLAGLVAGMLLVRAARRSGADVPAVISAVLAGYVAAVAGGILIPMAVDLVAHLARTGNWRLRWAGMTSFCGYRCGLVAVLISLRRSGNVSPAHFGDLAAAPLGIALALGRVGCFVAGCDYGQVTSVPWVVRFPAGSSAFRAHVAAGWVPPARGASLPVHPTQLYEIALGLGLFALALFASRTRFCRARDGRVFLLTLGAYALGRIAVESVRGDAGRGLYGAFSSAQIFGALVLAAIAALIWHRRRSAALAIALCALILTPAAPAAAEPAGDKPADGSRTGGKSADGVRTGDGPADHEPATGAGAAQPASPAGAAQPLDPYGHAAKPAPASTAPAQEPTAGRPAQKVSADAAAPPARRGRRYELGLLLGTSSAINRRDGQVPVLGGVSLAGAVEVAPSLSVALDIDSLASDVATHTSILIGGSFRKPLTGRLGLRGRAGVGFTLINFEDSSFDDVLASGVRFGSGVDWALGERFTLLAWPLTFDLTGSPALGGPILSYQLRIAVAYRGAVR